jgi:hypothetical protein
VVHLLTGLYGCLGPDVACQVFAGVQCDPLYILMNDIIQFQGLEVFTRALGFDLLYVSTTVYYSAVTATFLNCVESPASVPPCPHFLGRQRRRPGDVLQSYPKYFPVLFSLHHCEEGTTCPPSHDPSIMSSPTTRTFYSNAPPNVVWLVSALLSLSLHSNSDEWF